MKVHDTYLIVKTLEVRVKVTLDISCQILSYSSDNYFSVYETRGESYSRIAANAAPDTEHTFSCVLLCLFTFAVYPVLMRSSFGDKEGKGPLWTYRLVVVHCIIQIMFFIIYAVCEAMAFEKMIERTISVLE
jgi:hypothetical protein